MSYRFILIASAALVAASPALAQQSADPPPRQPSVTTEPTADEPIPPRGPREEVYVTGARSVPVQRVDGARTVALGEYARMRLWHIRLYHR